jgi:1-deoxy-D-xylulose-5-phosphate reductoisomerase
VGRSTLAVIALHPERFRVSMLGAHRSWQAVVEQALQFRPATVVLVDEEAAAKARAALRDRGSTTQVESGEDALAAAVGADNVDMVMAAIVGAAGLQPTLAAVRAGKRVLLANKESLVMTGPLLMDEARRAGAQLIPIDSEHNAIFQCMPAGYLPGDEAKGVTRIILTASGGPFRLSSAAKMAQATPDEACAHPKWKMGRKISVDSATLMNKGLEVIEATLLFGLPEPQVDVVVHPQSVVHSLVEYADGSMLAQLGAPDMRTPIAQALAWPERFASGVQSLDLIGMGPLEFEPPDHVRFPSLALARAAARGGGTAPTVLNAANEVAVQAFLDRRLNFVGIATVIDKVLQRLDSSPVKALGDVLEADAAARRLAESLIELSAGAFA